MNNQKTNYSKVTTNPAGKLMVEQPEVTNVTESVVEEPFTEAPAVEETVVPKPQVEVKPDTGFVVDCKKLRVRKFPTKLAEVLCEIPADSTVTINLKDSSAEFYKVKTEAGVEGYCMKKFIAVV